MTNKGTPTSRKNAAQWSAPGGGYDQFVKGDAAREKELPVGGVAPMRSPKVVKRKAGGKRGRKR